MPHGHWKTTTFVAGLRASGLVAPFVLDGSINRNAFETHVALVLVPDLRPGDVVVMDNLSSHKGPRVRDMIEAAGATLLYLPRYSPDFNPIENAFAKLKALLRKAAERTVEGLWNTVDQILDAFTRRSSSPSWLSAMPHLRQVRRETSSASATALTVHPPATRSSATAVFLGLRFGRPPREAVRSPLSSCRAYAEAHALAPPTRGNPKRVRPPRRQSLRPVRLGPSTDGK